MQPVGGFHDQSGARLRAGSTLPDGNRDLDALIAGLKAAFQELERAASAHDEAEATARAVIDDPEVRAVADLPVPDLERLTSLNAEDSRRVSAAFLIQHHGCGGNGKLHVAEPVLHVNEHVLQSAIADDEALCLRFALLLAVRV